MPDLITLNIGTTWAACRAKVQAERTAQERLDRLEQLRNPTWVSPKERQHAEWVKSLEISQMLPRPTPAEFVRAVQTGKPLWKSAQLLAWEKAEKAKREEAERTDTTLVPLPEIELP